MRSLRVGVLLGDTLVEERVFDGSIPVTIGQSLKCALSIPADGVPREHVLFVRDDAGWSLRSLGGEVSRLAHGARGKLAFGDARVLYQEVESVAAVPRPHLPPHVRGTLADRIDGRLAAIVGISLAVNFGIALSAWMQDTDTAVLGVASAQLPFHQDTMEVTLPDEPPAPTTTPTATTPGVATPIAPQHDVSHPVTVHEPHVANPMPDPAQLREEAIRMADLMVGPTSKPNGTPGSMSSRAPGADLKTQIDETKDVRVEIGDPSRSRTSPTELAKPRKGTVVQDPHFVQQDATEKPLPPITLGPVQSDTHTTLTPDAVLDKIQHLYIGGLQRCYAKGLLHDATLAGRVRVEFTVDETGRVSDASASGSADEVDTCIAGQMRHWAFAIPHDKQSHPTDASFGISLALAK